MDLKSKIRAVENFPKEGINFKDITTLLIDGEAYNEVIDRCIELTSDIEYDVIVGPEARGFLIAAPMSVKTKKGFIPVRKPGKLPYDTVSYEYDLEYGSDVLEIHKDAIKPGDKVLIADDLLATGGTVKAVTELIESLGGEVVGLVFLMELTFLNGRDLLGNKVVKSILQYED